MTRLALILACVTLSACAERHEGRGLVLGVDQASRTLTVSHEPIPGLMDAMVMPFTAASPAELQGLQPGDRIQFRMNVGRGETTIDRIKILSAAPPAASATAGASKALAIGDTVPDFSLVNQDAVPITLSELRGRVVVVGFIYTRCPLPDYCPRVMTNLTSLRDRFGDRLGSDLVLLTVTFDPQHDTAEKMKAYAARYGADIPGWHLLTGSREETTRVCTLLGVEFYPEEGMLTHSLQTAVISRDGRLAARIEGKDFSTRQLADLVELQLASR
jgi:protein SCO1/2